MIYHVASKKFRSFLSRVRAPLSFISVGVSEPEAFRQLYVEEKKLYKRKHSVKTFLVQDATLPWYLDIFAATVSQCRNPSERKNLCVVASRMTHVQQKNKKYHASSRILYLPEVEPFSYAGLNDFDTLLLQVRRIRHAVKNIEQISLRNECVAASELASLIFPCLAEPVCSQYAVDHASTAYTIGDDEEEMCIICLDQPRRFRWRACYHQSGPDAQQKRSPQSWKKLLPCGCPCSAMLPLASRNKFY